MSIGFEIMDMHRKFKGHITDFEKKIGTCPQISGK
jgi:hypothetical protein